MPRSAFKAAFILDRCRSSRGRSSEADVAGGARLTHQSVRVGSVRARWTLYDGIRGMLWLKAAQGKVDGPTGRKAVKRQRLNVEAARIRVSVEYGIQVFGSVQCTDVSHKTSFQFLLNSPRLIPELLIEH